MASEFISPSLGVSMNQILLVQFAAVSFLFIDTRLFHSLNLTSAHDPTLDYASALFLHFYKHYPHLPRLPGSYLHWRILTAVVRAIQFIDSLTVPVLSSGLSVFPHLLLGLHLPQKEGWSVILYIQFLVCRFTLCTRLLWGSNRKEAPTGSGAQRAHSFIPISINTSYIIFCLPCTRMNISFGFLHARCLHEAHLAIYVMVSLHERKIP